MYTRGIHDQALMGIRWVESVCGGPFIHCILVARIQSNLVK